MIRSLCIAVTIKTAGTVKIVVLTGAVHLVNGVPSGHLPSNRTVLFYTNWAPVKGLLWFALVSYYA
jgi:hypothetical protein